MTSHEPDPFAFCPFRRSDPKEPEWSLLIRYIKQNFPGNFNSQIQAAVDRLAEYKKVIAATCHNDLKQPPNEAFIEQTLKPYVQLVATAQAHLPLHGNSVKNLTFEWRDSLDDGFKHQSTNSNLELFSCIMNIGAAYAYTASVDAESGTVDGVKNAFKTYQLAAGCYQFAESFLVRLPPQAVVRDATVESLGVMQKVCLAHAHHCSYLKAEFEMKGKHVLLSKMAAEGAKLYDDVAKNITAQGWSRTAFVKDLDVYASNSSHIFNARAHLHLAAERMEVGEIGDAIARYNAANALLQRTTKFANGNMNAWLNGIRAFATEHHSKAVSANETVYFLRIPKELPPLELLGKGLGKPTPPPPLCKVISNRDADPFFGIVPAHIADVASKHFNAMQQHASAASKAISVYRERTRGSLNALGVTAAIESVSSETKDQGRVPEPLRSKILSLRPAEGGTRIVENLVTSVTQVEELRDACIAKLLQIGRILAEENQQDEAYAQQYGERLWRTYRPASLLCPHSQEIQKHIIQQNEQLVRVVTEPVDRLKGVLASSLRELTRLDWPMDDLDGLMPYTKTKAVKEQARVVMDAVDTLKKLVQRFDQIDEQNAQKLKELNNALQNDAVVHQLSSVDADQHEAILDAAGNEVQDIASCIRGNISAGEALLNQAQDIMGSLAMTRSEDPVATEIQKVCNMIETAIDLYQRLSQDVIEYGRCASQSLEVAEGLLSSAQSFTLSRSLEAEDIRANVERQIAAKSREMENKRQADATIIQSQQRQDELRRELELLERQRAEAAQGKAIRAQETATVQQVLQQQASEVDRSERMQQLLARQRDANTVGGSQPPSTYSAPPPPYPPPPSTFTPQQQQQSNSAHQQQPLYANFQFSDAPAQHQGYQASAPPVSMYMSPQPVQQTPQFSAQFQQSAPQQQQQQPYVLPQQQQQPYVSQQQQFYPQAQLQPHSPQQQQQQYYYQPPAPNVTQQPVQSYVVQLPHPNQFQYLPPPK